MNIKKAHSQDAHTISQIHATSWKGAYQNIIPQAFLFHLQTNFWVSTFENWLDNNLFTSLLLYEGMLPVGCITFGKGRDTAYAGWGEIVSLYILPDYFNMGFGKKLVETAILEMKKQLFHSIYLWVLEENSNAIAFYTHIGFTATKEKLPFEIENKPLVDVRYILHLND